MKGERRNPTTVWLLTIATCGLYGFYWWYLVGNELKNYLGKEDLNPTMDLLISLVCGVYGILYLPIKYGPLIQEAQQRAGLADAEDKGMSHTMFMLLCYMGFKNMQEELNRVWEAGGGAPATF